MSQVPVSPACNPSYSGGTHQEDGGLNLARAKSSVRLYLEKPFTKIGLVKWLKVRALSSNSRYQKKVYERVNYIYS
jgi:hypothetical protein